MRGARARLATAGIGALLLGPGCGGGPRQDAGAPGGTFSVAVARATFPARQSVAEPATLVLVVRNTGRRRVPGLAVTISTYAGGSGRGGETMPGFATRSGDAGLADDARPAWILEAGPDGGATAYAGTWAVGALPAGASTTLRWRVTPVRPGRYTVAWRLAPALEGDARLTGSDPRGAFPVRISAAPVPARVDKRGRVIRNP